MAVKREHIGEARNGEPVYAYHLTNKNGMRVVVLGLGATLRDIVVPAADGSFVDVCLGQADLAGYYHNSGNLGAVVGPVANRTALGKYVIDQVEYEVDYRFAKQKVTLRYSPDMQNIYVVEADGALTPIRLLNKHENASVKREKVHLTGGVD